MARLNVVYRDPASLVPRQNNPRTHTNKQIRQIADSIARFGFVNPVLIDEDNRIVAGHGRVEAAKRLKLTEVPTIRLEDMSADELRAYVIADNRLAEKAGWDKEILAIELQHLACLDVEIDVTITGFETPEIDILLDEVRLAHEEDEEDPDDAVPVVDDSIPPVTEPGDLWQIGPHRLLCGDATVAASYARLMDGAAGQMVFTDPPYNVAIDGHVCGLGKVRHREFVMASGEMSESEFTSFLASTFANLAAFSVDGALHFVCMDWRHIGEVLAAGKASYSALKNLCVWIKTNAGMGSLYRSQHELIFVFKKGEAPHINNVELGRFGRHRSNVWRYPGTNTFGKHRDAELALHPTVKPVALVADAIKDCSHRGGIILDAFAGSGTTLIAAHRTGRRGFGLELDPHYCDVIIRRLAAAGLKAVHAETGKSFAETETEKQRTRPAIAEAGASNPVPAEDLS